MEKNKKFINVLLVVIVILSGYLVCDKLLINNKQTTRESNTGLTDCVTNDALDKKETLNEYGIDFYSSDEKFESLIGKYVYSDEESENNEEDFFEISKNGKFNFHFHAGDGSYFVGDEKSYKLMIQYFSEEEVFLFFVDSHNKYLPYAFRGFQKIDKKYIFSTLTTTPTSGSEEYLWVAK